jgi:predicted transcriptional regulator
MRNSEKDDEMARRPERRADGALEREVLQVLWTADRPLPPGEINERLGSGHAYTSVATILTRLHAKGLVERSPSGRAYVYTAVIDESDLAARRIAEVLDATTDRSQVLSRFIDGLSAREAKTVRAMLDDVTERRSRG